MRRLHPLQVFRKRTQAGQDSCQQTQGTCQSTTTWTTWADLVFQPTNPTTQSCQSRRDDKIKYSKLENLKPEVVDKHNVGSQKVCSQKGGDNSKVW